MRTFFKNKVAVFFLFVILVTLAFTFIQPLLPGQRDPNVVNYNELGLFVANLPPSEEYWFGT